MEFDEVIKKLVKLSDTENIEGMERFGIKSPKAYGVKIPELRKIAQKTGKNHLLAKEFWKADYRETKILACMIEDVELVTEEQMDRWVSEFDNWEICDQCCMNLFWKTLFVDKKIFEWSTHEEEFVKRAAFTLIAVLAVHDKKARDFKFEQFFPIIIHESVDNRNYVKKSVNWALRQIGKRNIELNIKAIKIAEEIHTIDSKGAKWIATDALKELKSEKVQRRLKTQEKT
ncbi:MAG: DNA alkylation repair protein [Methanobacterium sp.]|uniref:DNA alkylation repair protein n=1 Tax=Methanobacterium sp. TaxID=2164 RepID=UPI003C73E8A5